MICSYCHMPVVVVPSVKIRIRKHGGTAADYLRLFPDHPACIKRHAARIAKKLKKHQRLRFEREFKLEMKERQQLEWQNGPNFLVRSINGTVEFHTRKQAMGHAWFLYNLEGGRTVVVINRTITGLEKEIVTYRLPETD